MQGSIPLNQFQKDWLFSVDDSFPLRQNHFDAAHTLLFLKNREINFFCRCTSVPFFHGLVCVPLLPVSGFVAGGSHFPLLPALTEGCTGSKTDGAALDEFGVTVNMTNAHSAAEIALQ